MSESAVSEAFTFSEASAVSVDSGISLFVATSSSGDAETSLTSSISGAPPSVFPKSSSF